MPHCWLNVPHHAFMGIFRCPSSFAITVILSPDLLHDELKLLGLVSFCQMWQIKDHGLQPTEV